MTATRSAISAAILLLLPAAGAQHFNIDLANEEGTPSPTYAAAGMPGTWNGIANPFPAAAALVDTTGAATDVTLETSGGTDYSWNGSPNGNKTTGDAEALMDDLWAPDGQGSTLTLSNLRPGLYDVRVYASAPDAIDYFTDIRMNDSAAVTIGGNWPTPFQYVEPITHARFIDVRVGPDGRLTLTVAGFQGFPSVNGLQLELTVPACTGDLNGDGVTGQSDLGILLAAYGTCPGDALYNEFAGLLADDPCVTQADLGVVLAFYGCVP